MRLYQIRVDIYEPGSPFPIVIHHFQGRDREEALAIHNAHRESDKFMRECEDKSCFRRNVPCTAKLFEGWVSV